MTSVENHVILDNLEYDASIISRVENLRRVLRELRDALRDERLNLHQEIEMTILHKFMELQRNYQTLSDQMRYNSVNHARIPDDSAKLHREACSNGDTAKTNYLACLGSSMYQRAVDELRDELNSFEERLSASATSSYKRKIYDLEAICCADLNRVRSRFVSSLQTFENTIDSIEEVRCSRRAKPASCRCAARNHRENEPTFENDLPDGFRWHRGPATRNAKHDRWLPRSKSLVMDKNCGLWTTFMCAKRYSDSEMYGKAYRSLKYLEDPQMMTNMDDSDSNPRLDNSITTIYPPSQFPYYPF